MNIPKALVASGALALLFSPAYASSTTNAPKAEATNASPRPATAEAPENALKRAMAVADVKRIMGEPAEVKPMAAPTGKAEIWVYRRKIGDSWVQIQTASKPIVISSTDSNGLLHQTTIGEEPIFTNEHRVTEDVVSLLMFNDHFLERKVTREIHRNYH